MVTLWLWGSTAFFLVLHFGTDGFKFYVLGAHFLQNFFFRGIFAHFWIQIEFFHDFPKFRAGQDLLGQNLDVLIGIAGDGGADKLLGYLLFLDEDRGL